MFKFIKNYAETIAGIDVYPLASLLIFFIFFVTMGIWVFRLKKSYITEVSAMPLEQSVNNPLNNNSNEIE